MSRFPSWRRASAVAGGERMTIAAVRPTARARKDLDPPRRRPIRLRHVFMLRNRYVSEPLVAPIIAAEVRLDQ